MFGAPLLSQIVFISSIKPISNCISKPTKYLLGQKHHIVSPQMRALPAGRVSHVF